jgi:putative ATP-binding cassette transporter
LLEDRQIYLFDEWAADQDPEFKEVFYKQLVPALLERGKTAIVITHDDRYFHLARRLLVMEEGRIGSIEERG